MRVPKPVILPWRARVLYLYFDDELGEMKRAVLAAAISAIDRAQSLLDLESHVTEAVEAEGAYVVSFVLRADHYDPMGSRISIAFGKDDPA